MKTEILRVHECSRCQTAAKLPYRADASAFCSVCNAMTAHVLKTVQETGMSLEDRIKVFMDRMAWRVRPDDAAEPEPPPVPPEEITKGLKAGKFPQRAIDSLPVMRGKGLVVSDMIVSPERRSDSHWILFGGNGTGKTCIATRAAALRIQARKSGGLYCSVPDLRGALSSAMDRRKPQDEITGPLKTAPFLVLDEAQDSGEKDWLPGILREIADARYRALKPMVWLLNSESDADVEKKLGARIVDRANETGGMLHCDWQSYRAA